MPRPSEDKPKAGALRWAYRVGLGLAISSYLAYVLLPGVPFLPFSRHAKTAIGGGLLVMHQIMLWAGVALAGPEAVHKVKHFWDRRRPLAPRPLVEDPPSQDSK